ncbi:nociceptin receptor-like [Bacillus rossius redtenbacheri]|uniref:nociceptin receptor-like n=1 Tax=Bacillus rossius redtenbacheri TaxID=93214 RepID=UPI002FDEACE5
MNATLRVVEDIERYYTPVLILLGSVGNCVSVVVFFCTKLRKLSSSTYLAALAASDTAVLACLLANWLDMVADTDIKSRPVVCEAFHFVLYACCFLSAWLVAAFTVERFFAVLYPLRRPSVCTVARARQVLAALTVCAAAASTPVVFVVKLQPKPNSSELVCDLDQERRGLAHAFNYADTVLTFVVPFGVIASLNMCIVSAVWRLAWVRRSMTFTSTAPRGDAAPASSSSRRKHQQHLRSSGSQSKVTKMLLVVSTVFLILNLPGYLFRIVGYVQVSHTHMVIFLVRHVCMLLYTTNFGINFVLYCVSGQNFRRALQSLCCPRRRHNPDTPPATTVWFAPWMDLDELDELERAVAVVSEMLRSSGSVAHRRVATLNGAAAATPGGWRDAHELLPLSKGHGNPAAPGCLRARLSVTWTRRPAVARANSPPRGDTVPGGYALNHRRVFDKASPALFEHAKHRVTSRDHAAGRQPADRRVEMCPARRRSLFMSGPCPAGREEREVTPHTSSVTLGAPGVIAS